MLRRAKLYTGAEAVARSGCAVCVKAMLFFCSWETCRNAIEDHLAGRVMHYDMHGARGFCCVSRVFFGVASLDDLSASDRVCGCEVQFCERGFSKISLWSKRLCGRQRCGGLSAPWEVQWLRCSGVSGSFSGGSAAF